jgi:hypothetical protein
MNTKLLGVAVLSALPLAFVGGWVFANAQSQPKQEMQQVSNEPYICPATGEALRCPSCCPLSRSK